MERLSQSIEYYNLTVKSVVASLIDLQSIIVLEEKAQSNTLAYFNDLPKTGSDEEQNQAESDLKRLIASNLSVWKPIAIELLNERQEKKNLEDSYVKSINDLKKQLEDQKNECEQEKQDLIDTIKRLEEEAKDLEENYVTSINNLKKQLEDQQKACEQEKQKLQDEIKRLEKEAKDMEDGHVKSINDLKEKLEEQKKICEQEKQKLNDDNKKLQEALDRANAEIAALKSSLLEMEKSRDDYKSQVVLAIQQLTQANQTLQANQVEMERLRQEIQRLTDELNKVKEALNVCEAKQCPPPPTPTPKPPVHCGPRPIHRPRGCGPRRRC